MKKRRNLTNLLFIDSDQEILNLLKALFNKNEEYEVFTAIDICEAEEIIQRQSIDLIVGDLILDRDECLHKLFQKIPDCAKVFKGDFLDIKSGKVVEDKKDGTLYINDYMLLSQLVRNLINTKDKKKDIFKLS